MLRGTGNMYLSPGKGRPGTVIHGSGGVIRLMDRVPFSHEAYSSQPEAWRVFTGTGKEVTNLVRNCSEPTRADYITGTVSGEIIPGYWDMNGSGFGRGIYGNLVMEPVNPVKVGPGITVAVTGTDIDFDYELFLSCEYDVYTVSGSMVEQINRSGEFLHGRFRDDKNWGIWDMSGHSDRFSNLVLRRKKADLKKPNPFLDAERELVFGKHPLKALIEESVKSMNSLLKAQNSVLQFTFRERKYYDSFTDVLELIIDSGTAIVIKEAYALTGKEGEFDECYKHFIQKIMFQGIISANQSLAGNRIDTEILPEKFETVGLRAAMPGENIPFDYETYMTGRFHLVTTRKGTVVGLYKSNQETLLGMLGHVPCAEGREFQPNPCVEYSWKISGEALDHPYGNLRMIAHDVLDLDRCGVKVNQPVFDYHRNQSEKHTGPGPYDPLRGPEITDHTGGVHVMD
jgi:hypothetical protein